MIDGLLDLSFHHNYNLSHLYNGIWKELVVDMNYKQKKYHTHKHQIDEELIVTHHAKKRLKQRMGINKKNYDKISKRALDEGLKHSETSGLLNKYLNKIFLSHDRKAGNLRVYHQKIFVFTSENILVTILQLPPHFYKIEKKDLDMRDKKSQENLN